MSEKKKKRKSQKKNAREERFPYEYVIDLNGQKAAERCGVLPKGARVWASRLLTKPNIQNKIKELQEEQKKNALRTAQDWEREVDMVAFFRGHKEFYKPDGSLKDVKDLTDEQLAQIREIESQSTGGGDKPVVRVTNLRLWDKLKALDMKAKALGIYKQTMVIEDPYMAYMKEIARQAQEGKG